MDEIAVVNVVHKEPKVQRLGAKREDDLPYLQWKKLNDFVEKKVVR